MSSYPVVIFSSKYQAVDHLLPKLPEKPIEPELKLIKKNWFEKLILWCDDYDDMHINNQRRERYEQQMVNYREDLAIYQRKVKEALSDTNLSIFRESQREKMIKTSVRGEDLSRDVQKGRYEEFFIGKLRSAFGTKITDTIEFTLPNGNAFVPDAAYIDSLTGLCIDIEIDEPYTIPGGMPIHYIGGPDDYRNSYFSNMGWFVIRLAEEQVAKHFEECIRFIKEFIAQLKFGTVPSFQFPVNQWTKADAYTLSESNYRNNY